jgi:hypothetical protein
MDVFFHNNTFQTAIRLFYFDVTLLAHTYLVDFSDCCAFYSLVKLFVKGRFLLFYNFTKYHAQYAKERFTIIGEKKTFGMLIHRLVRHFAFLSCFQKLQLPAK